MLVPTPPHSAGHRKVERLAGRDCGVAVICTLKRRGIECSSPSDEGEAGVMVGTGGWTVEKRESWTGLVSGLSAYYQSPGRLAGLRRRFESAFRQPGLDPATFATDLGMLAIQGFGDMKEQARDTMIRDKFIAGQGQCALRRQLDGFAQDTPKLWGSCGQLSCVGESSDSNRVSTVNYDSEVGSQPSDSRTWE